MFNYSLKNRYLIPLHLQGEQLSGLDVKETFGVDLWHALRVHHTAASRLCTLTFLLTKVPTASCTGTEL